MTNAITRGIRNNNPGNIDRDGTPWQGMADDQSSDKRFIVFKSAPYGIRALARVIVTYQDKHGLSTVRRIIGRWAPPVENDTEAYVDAVAASVGVGPDDVINVHDFNVMKPLVKAIIKHENGVQPYADSVINYGLTLAGITAVAEPKPIAKSPTVIGSAIASAGTAGGAVVSQIKDTDIHNLVGAQDTIEQAKEAVSMTMGFWSYAGIAMAVLTVIGIGIVLWSKYDRRKRGVE
jgi:hypothetical protein